MHIQTRKFSASNFGSGKCPPNRVEANSSFLVMLGLAIAGAFLMGRATKSSSVKSSDTLIDSENVKLAIFVPVDPDLTNGDPSRFVEAVSKALGEADAGYIGGYRSCSFSVEGISRFMKPAGAEGIENSNNEIFSFKEVRIEVVCAKKVLRKAIAAAQKVHPWEVMGYDVMQLKELKIADLPG